MLPVMFGRLLISAVLANAAIGHLCLMPMAFASEMPMAHNEAIEMVMTPMVPMSPMHCEHCAKLVKVQPSPMNTSCAGHCFSQADGAVGMVTSHFQSIFARMAVPPARHVLVAAVLEAHGFEDATAPPLNSPKMRTVVLLQ